jgi:integrase/recombinase XerD
MRIHGMGDKAQKAHIRAIKHFAGFLGRSPDTATPDDLRAYQLQMTDTEVTPPTFNARIMALPASTSSNGPILNSPQRITEYAQPTE